MKEFNKRLARKDSYLRLWKHLERARTILGEDDAGFSNLLGMELRQFVLLRERRGRVPATAVAFLANRLGIPYEKVMEGDLGDSH